MSLVDVAVLALAGISLLVAFVSALAAMQARAGVSSAAYGVGRQQSRRAMQVALLRMVIFFILALILFGVYGLSTGPEDVLSTDPESLPTAAASVTAQPAAETATSMATPAASPTAQAVSASATATTVLATATASATLPPTVTSTPVPTAIVDSEVGLYLRDAPGGTEEVELLPNGTVLILLDGQETVDGEEWQEVRAPSGNEGWVAVAFIEYQQ